jgi:hypothetical protein
MIIIMLAGAVIVAKRVAVVLMLVLMQKGAVVHIAINATAGSAQSRRPWSGGSRDRETRTARLMKIRSRRSSSDVLSDGENLSAYLIARPGAGSWQGLMRRSDTSPWSASRRRGSWASGFSRRLDHPPTLAPLWQFL